MYSVGGNKLTGYKKCINEANAYSKIKVPMATDHII